MARSHLGRPVRKRFLGRAVGDLEEAAAVRPHSCNSHDSGAVGATEHLKDDPAAVRGPTRPEVAGGSGLRDRDWGCRSPIGGDQIELLIAYGDEGVTVW